MSLIGCAKECVSLKFLAGHRDQGVGWRKGVVGGLGGLGGGQVAWLLHYSLSALGRTRGQNTFLL